MDKPQTQATLIDTRHRRRTIHIRENRGTQSRMDKPETLETLVDTRQEEENKL